MNNYYSLNSKEMFPSFDSSTQERRVGTTFYGDFKTAEDFVLGGSEPNALEDTWNRAWGEWKNNAGYVIELCLVMNHLSWEAFAKGKVVLSKWYSDKYYYSFGRIFSSGTKDEPLPEGCTPFTEAEQTLAFDVLD